MSEETQVLALAVLLKVFDESVKTFAENAEEYSKYEFIRVLAGGNLKFPEQVLEIAKSKLEKEL